MDGERRGDILLYTCLWAWGWAFQPLQYWHRGLSVPWRRFSSITGLYSLDANALPWLWWSKTSVVLFLHLSVSSAVSDSLRPHGPQPARLLCPWDFPWKWVAISSSRGIFLIWGSNPHLLHLLHWQWILYHCVTWENPQMHPVQFSSVAQLRPTLCDPMNQSTPGLPVHHQLPEFTQTHVHWVGDAIQPSHPLSSPSPPAPNPSQHQGIFQWVNSSYEVAKVLEFQMHPDIAKYPSRGRSDGKINPRLRHFGQGIKRRYNL